MLIISYGLIASGNYQSHFSNAGEEALLTDPAGNPVTYFTYMDEPPWPGGIFASNSLLGSKSGGSVAAAWAVVKLMGLKGYMANASEVMNAVKKFRKGSGIPGDWKSPVIPR